MPFLDVPHIPAQIAIEKAVRHTAHDMVYMHFHLCCEFYFLLSGERRYFIGHTIYDVEPGDVVLIPKNELHQTTTLHNKGFERYVVYFYEESVRELLNKLGEDAVHTFLSGGCFRLPPDQSEKIRKALEQLALEYNLNDPYTQPMAQNILHHILLTVFRHGVLKSREKNKSTDRIQEVARYISENYASPITLHDAAQKAYMEDTHFSKQFKRMTGFGFHEYLIQTRIKAAEQLLLYTDLDMNAIAEQCGFSGSNYFGDAFRRYKGMSPSTYRKQNS